CSFLCFDGLLLDSQDNKIMMDTVFTWAMEHAFTKAQMHTDLFAQISILESCLMKQQHKSNSSFTQ
ncbi:hypothetical protein EDD18DRAFT_1075441, partial [Armillaria luteobubalina]